MSPNQASSDDFPRLVGAENCDVWKTRVCAALDGKHPIGFVKKLDYDGVSEEESEESEGETSDVTDTPKHKPADTADVDSNAVDSGKSESDMTDVEDAKKPKPSERVKVDSDAIN